ncbi:MAG: V-type ATP synthase subunit E [Trueperaceae bacterium]|nr:V-type ATP synthase subunit E [Trueperaceae bacterium]
MADLAALLEKEAGAEIEAILSEARERASEIVSQAEREAEALVQRAERQAQSRRQAAQVRARSSAQLEAASMRLGAQQKAIDSVFNEVKSRIDALPKDEKRYAAVLDALLKEALEDVAGEPDAVVAHPDAASAVRAAMERAGVSAELRTDASVSGGVRIETGSVSVENTLPGRLAALRDELASEVAAVLTSKEP